MSRYEWIFDKIKDPLKDRDRLIRQYVCQMLNRTIRMFDIKGLPDTIPKKDLMLLLQCNGFAIIAEADGALYAFDGGLGGEPNPYYLPTLAVVANPALRFNKTLEIDKDCVVILNDSLYQGLMPILTKYAAHIVDAEITLHYNVLNSRVPKIIQADNDTTAASAREFFEQIEQGSAYGIITTNEFYEGITAQDFAGSAPITQTIEALQYLKGSMFNEIGLKASFNMKREAINEAEASMNENILYPLIDDMREQLELGFERVNAMFGTNITVEFESVWEMNREEDELHIEQLEADVEATEAEAVEPEPEEEVTEESEETTDAETEDEADRHTDE